MVISLLTDEQKEELSQKLSFEHYWQAEGIIKHYLEKQKIEYERIDVCDDPEVVDKQIGLIFIYYKQPDGNLAVMHLVITPNAVI